MSKKNDNEFFDDLDKTTDLLKAFKPHVDEEKSIGVEDLEFLYKEYKTAEKEEKEKNVKKEKKKETVKPVKKVEKTKKVEVKEPSKIEDEKLDEVTDLSSIIDKMNETVKENKKTKKKEKVKDKENKETNNVKRRIKPGVIEIIFWAFSTLFIIGCFVVYGSRFIKYYKIYNPKSETGEALTLLSTTIAKDSPLVYEGEGLYMQNGEYVYKGEKVNNYIKYSGLLWRIIKTNSDGSIDIVLSESINSLVYSKNNDSYINSDINKYLNNYFIKYLNKDMLTKTTVCTDDVDNLTDFSCNKKDINKYVRLLSVNEFLNSKAESTTYIANKDTVLWLNTNSKNGAWQVNGLNLSIADKNRALSIKPVVTLKPGVALLKGTGSIEEPYMIEKDSSDVHVGEYVKLGDDLYVVYNTSSKYLDLALNNVLPATYRFDVNSTNYDINSKYSLAYYLNMVYYNKLSYKDKLVSKKWDAGVFETSYEDINKSSVEAKVGLLNYNDLKFNNTLSNYYLMTSYDNGVYLYDSELVTSKPAISRAIRPAIRIENKVSGKGTLESPYVVE